MAWTEIEDYNVPDMMNAAGLTAIKGNIEYLHLPNRAKFHHSGIGSDYTVSGSLGVDLDGTNFALSITTNGKPVMACFYGVVLTSTLATSLRMSIIVEDAVAHAGRNLYANFDAEFTFTTKQGRGWFKPFPYLPAGTYTFKVIWGVSGGGTGTLFVANRPRFSVWEK